MASLCIAGNLAAQDAVAQGAVAQGAVAPSAVEGSRHNAIVQAIEKASPAVVSVNVVHIQAERVLDPFSRDFFGLFDPRPKVRLREEQANSVGSGFFFDDQGHVLTNYHVVEEADKVASVSLPDGRVLDATLVGADKRTDLAVLKVQGTSLPYAPLGDSNNLMTGEWVIAIGNPFGVLIKDPQPSVSVGVVSANHRRISPSVGEGERLYQDMIQTDAAINPGNSGGPLVNASGEIVGVNTMIFSPSGGSIGLGFAIPINRAKRVADEILRYGRRRDPWAGFKVEDVSSLRSDFRQQLGVQAKTGCIVVNILTGTPAYDAGLRPGDVVVSIGGRPVTMAYDLDFALWSLFVDDPVTIEYDRQGVRKTATFKIKELAE
jgi:serine protease Do